MWTLLLWMIGVTGMLCQQVQAESDPLPPDFLPLGINSKIATRPSVETHNVPAGFPAVFTCRHHDIAKKTVSWQHNGAKILDATLYKNTRYAVITEPGTSTLTIEHVQVNDQGTVTSQVQTEARLVENTVTFEVSAIAVDVNRRSVIDEIAYIPSETTQVTYTCAIKYAPKDARLSWFDKETELTTIICRDKNCDVESYTDSVNIKKAVVVYSAVKFVPKNGLRCKLINSTGGTAQKSAIVKLKTLTGEPQFCGMDVTKKLNNQIQLHSGETSTITCTAYIDPKHAPKLLLYMNNTKTAESVIFVRSQRIMVTYRFIVHPENNAARVKCNAVNQTHEEMEPFAKLPLRVLFSPEDGSVTVVAPATVSPNQTFEVRCHSEHNYPMPRLHWFAFPGKSCGTSITHTEHKNGGATTYGRIWVTPAAGATSISIKCMARKPGSGQIVLATAVVYVKTESANNETGAEITGDIQPTKLTEFLHVANQPADHDKPDAALIGALSVAAIAGMVGMMMVVLWIIHRTSDQFAYHRKIRA
ncbi:uncharacterized protein LOC129594431 isoform X2 [Paramacrobiotus metropolitanus]|uniref:uncharacterized protein LOC129594431 isoform X2 n=1 Tax=Paramacrobiotus metropolitanus TaxID=2943436 RepID=UPI00244595CC|nr:uncharacterized protein LOC129594431 isoform X2 [Paramacrobiotus metropolitanus]